MKVNVALDYLVSGLLFSGTKPLLQQNSALVEVKFELIDKKRKFIDKLHTSVIFFRQHNFR